MTIGAAGLNSMCTDSMVARHDPRYGIYIDTVGDLWGAPGYLNAFYGNDNSPVIFFTYAEQKFIEAEAKLMTGDNAGAQSAYTAAITADMTKKGVAAGDIAAYLTAYGTLAGTQQQMLQQIIYEKYVSLYLQTESWCDYRRLNNPLNMVPNAGVLAEIPRRFIYPTNEKLYNPNIPTTSSSLLSPRLWWDN